MFIDDEDVTRVAPQKRTVGMMFQDYAVFPHLSVADNIGFDLVERRVNRGEITARRVRYPRYGNVNVDADRKLTSLEG